jgi:hypothetical protein
MILSAPRAGMPVTSADLKAHAAIKIDRGVKIVHGVDDVIEAVRHCR